MPKILSAGGVAAAHKRKEKFEEVFVPSLDLFLFSGEQMALNVSGLCIRGCVLSTRLLCCSELSYCLTLLVVLYCSDTDVAHLIISCKSMKVCVSYAYSVMLQLVLL